MKTISTATVLLLCAAPARADLIVVDSDGVHTFTDIQPAVDVARDGDTILVRTGVYGGFAVRDKELSIVCDLAGSAEVRGPIEVAGLAAQKTLVLIGLYVVPTSPGSALRVRDCDGIVWIDECVLAPAAISDCTTPEPGTLVEASRAVAFLRCGLYGPSASEGQGSGGDGLVLVDSSAFVHMCHVFGGYASYDACGATIDSGHGGTAVRTEGDAQIYVHGGSFDGADGAAGVHFAPGGDGGHGLAVSPFTEQVALGSFFQGGAGGAGGCSSEDCPDGSPGIAIDGELEVFDGVAPYVTGGAPAVEGSMTTTVLYGDAGDRVVLRISEQSTFEFDAGVRGMRLVRGGKLVAVGTPMPPSGAMGVQVAAPYVATPGGARRLFVQVIHKSTTGVYSYGGVRVMIVLDSALGT